MAYPFSSSAHEPVKPGELFNVVQFFPGSERHEYVARNIPSDAAVDIFFDHQNSIAARFGGVRRIIITDGDDCTVAEWVYGTGVSFP